MRKIESKYIKDSLKKCGIGIETDSISIMPYLGYYHKHNWDHGYDAIYGYNGSRREFYKDMEISVDCLDEYFKCRDIDSIIIAPCHNLSQFNYKFDKDDENNDIIQEILELMKKNRIRRGAQSGIEIPIQDRNVIEMAVEGAFRGVSKFCFFSAKANILIEPDHHFCITFWTRHINEEKELLYHIVRKYPDLIFFEKS
ncbi:hypothetical protein [Harryflintia acetispora]|uniref:hypothetical protein n=1 Tax=Harryflintia acetispora TaxID=1849041 RepID=UPI001896A912|nr:hypothetical protein [Harryflintia acetispora]